MPVVIVATLFAAIHVREPAPPMDSSLIFARLQLFAVASLWVVALLIFWLKYATGATLADFGVVPEELISDIRLGILAFFAITPAVYAIQSALTRYWPELAVPDPIPLLLLGLVLGTLYCRTHRIVPSIVLHSMFNTIGVLSVIAGSH